MKPIPFDACIENLKVIQDLMQKDQIDRGMNYGMPFSLDMIYNLAYPCSDDKKIFVDRLYAFAWFIGCIKNNIPTENLYCLSGARMLKLKVMSERGRSISYNDIKDEICKVPETFLEQDIKAYLITLTKYLTPAQYEVVLQYCKPQDVLDCIDDLIEHTKDKPEIRAILMRYVKDVNTSQSYKL